MKSRGLKKKEEDEDARKKKQERQGGEEGETYGDLSVRTALENWGFELSCTISRCLLQPALRRVKGGKG